MKRAAVNSREQQAHMQRERRLRWRGAQKYGAGAKKGALRSSRLRLASCTWRRMAESEAKQGSTSKMVRGFVALLRSVGFNGEQCGSIKTFRQEATWRQQESLMADRTVRGGLVREEWTRHIRRFLRSRAWNWGFLLC